MGSHIHVIVEIHPEPGGPWMLGMAQECIPFFGYAYGIFAQLGMPYRWPGKPLPAMGSAPRGLPEDISPAARYEAEVLEGFISWYTLRELVDFTRAHPWQEKMPKSYGPHGCEGVWSQFIAFLQEGAGRNVGLERVRIVFGID